MSKVIYKYHLELKQNQPIKMPIGAQILTAQLQDDTINLWALVDTYSEVQERIIEIFGTGSPLTIVPNRIYISTVQLEGFVWHIFEFKN